MCEIDTICCEERCLIALVCFAKRPKKSIWRTRLLKPGTYDLNGNRIERRGPDRFRV
jgi:hypothetical protein